MTVLDRRLNLLPLLFQNLLDSNFLSRNLRGFQLIQHGFRALRSTHTHLLTFWDTILDELEGGGGVDVIYTDFSKAFDKVETVLLHKIKECGINGKVGCWISAFLDPCSHQQAVGVDGTVSDLSPVVSGVPQGTVLNPYQ